MTGKMFLQGVRSKEEGSAIPRRTAEYVDSVAGRAREEEELG